MRIFDIEEIEAAAALLREGGVLAYPTEGVYGLGCDPDNRVAFDRIFAMKRRPPQQGVLLIAADFGQVRDWIDGYGAHASSGSETGIHALSKKNVTINDSYTGYWRDSVVKGSGRPCAGDSGSPAINTSRLTGSLVGPDLVIGLHSNADRPKTEACPSPGAYFRYTRLEDKLSFIKNTIAGIPGLTACTNGSKPGGWSYMICF